MSDTRGFQSSARERARLVNQFETKLLQLRAANKWPRALFKSICSAGSVRFGLQPRFSRPAETEYKMAKKCPLTVLLSSEVKLQGDTTTIHYNYYYYNFYYHFREWFVYVSA